MKIGIAVLAALLVFGCAKKEHQTPEQQKKEMSTQPIASGQERQERQENQEKRAIEEKFEIPRDGPYRALAEFDYPKSRAPLSEIEQEIRNATPQKYGDIETNLLAVLKSDQTSVAAKQFACRMLERVGSNRSVPTLSAMLEDEKLNHMARFALERMPGAAATRALRERLGSAKGPALVGIISSVGKRRDNDSLEKLAEIAMQPDPLASRAAVMALGEIGSSASVKALDDLAAKAPQSLQPLIPQAQIVAARQMTRDGRTQEAEAVFKKLADAKYPAEIRVAALAGLIDTSSNPSRLIIEMVQSEEDVMQSAALAALTPNTDKKRRDAVASAMFDAKPAAQLRLLAVLGDQQDVNLRSTLLRLIRTPENEQITAHALEAMITHGTAEDVPMLVGLATANNQPHSGPAKRTLQQMGAAGVDEALIALAEKSDTDGKATIVRTLAARNSTVAVPMLLKLVTGREAALIGEASTALGVVGTAEHLAPLTEIALSTESSAARNAAEGAIKAICSRTQDKESCANVILPALKKANSPAAKVGLLRTLSRLPIDKSLNEVRAAVSDADARVSDAAVRELADWPNIAAAQPLLQIARTGTNQTHAILALRGYIRLAGTKDLPAAERVKMYREALATAQRNEERKLVLAGLGDVPSIEALDMLQERMKDADLADDAASGTIRLAKQLGTSHNARMLALLREMRAQPGREALRGQIDAGIKTLEDIAERTQGFIVAWMVAGPYMQSGKNGGALFDVAFAPEKGDKTEWRPLIRPADSQDLWMVNFAKVLGQGNDRVAYLKTNLNSSREQQATLELGSDDGVKVWVNGKQVHANNAARALKQGEDKVKINLKPGSNTLLMKITQGGGDWAACARLRAADGSKITDVQISPE